MWRLLIQNTLELFTSLCFQHQPWQHFIIFGDFKSLLFFGFFCVLLFKFKDREVMAWCLWGSIRPLLLLLLQYGKKWPTQPRWWTPHLCTALELSATHTESPWVLQGWVESPHTAYWKKSVTSSVMDSKPAWGTRPPPGLFFRQK